MKDSIEQFLDDYKEGRIDVNALQRRINYMDWSQNKPMAMPMDYIESSEEPCETLVNREKSNDLATALHDLKMNLSDDDWNMFLMTANGCTQEEIAKKLHYTRSSVIRHMQRIAKIKPELRTLLKKDTPMYFADTPKDKLRYPMDIARKTTDSDGKVRCHLPEYLHTQDCDSVCTYCQNCTCKTSQG